MPKWLVLIGLMAPVTAGADTHIRTLAGSCAACHGTNGNSVGGIPALAGMDANQFSAKLYAFRSGEQASTVMFRHTKGLTDEEIGQLAAYFSKQLRTPASPPMSLRAFY